MAPRKRTRQSGKRFSRKYGKGRGKFSTAHRSKLGRPSRGLQSSRYQYSHRTIATVPSLNGGPFPANWSNNATLTSCMHDGMFKLDDLGVTKVAQIVSMYEAYRINAVKLEFIPSATITTPATNEQLVCWNFTDWSGNYAGGAAMPATADLALMQRCRKRQFINNQTLKVYCKVKQANEVLRDTILTHAYTRMRPKWVSTQNTDVNHYGLVTVFTNQNALVLPTLPVQVITTYYLECRGVK